MTDACKKRANAGPTVGEKRQEEFAPEKHGNTKKLAKAEARWIKTQCGSCGFLLGWRFVGSWTNDLSHLFKCISCHSKVRR